MQKNPTSCILFCPNIKRVQRMNYGNSIPLVETNDIMESNNIMWKIL